MPWLAAIGGIAASLGGAALSASGAKKVSYGKPITVDPEQVQQNYLNAQQRYLPQEYGYLNQIAALSDQQARQRLYEAAPWAQGYQQTAADTMGQYLKGQFSDAEMALLRKYAPEKALALGTPSSGFQNSIQLGNMLASLSQRQGQATTAYPAWQAGMTGQMMGQVPSLASITPTYAQYLNAITGNTATQNEFAMKQAEANAQPNPMGAALGSTISGLGGMLTRYGLDAANKPKQPDVEAEPWDSPYWDQPWNA